MPGHTPGGVVGDEGDRVPKVIAVGREQVVTAIDAEGVRALTAPVRRNDVEVNHLAADAVRREGAIERRPRVQS